MSRGKQEVVKKSGDRRVVVADSATAMDETNKNDIFVDGSHCGRNVGMMALKAGIRGMIGNDAGFGKNHAGVAALKLLEEHGIPAAAVSCMSAEIGSGKSTYEEGQISVANAIAEELGVAVGMSAKEAADKMLAAP